MTRSRRITVLANANELGPYTQTNLPMRAPHDMLGVAVTTFPQPAARRVRARQGPLTWFNGDIYRMPLTTAETGGAIGIVEATVPPGGGPAPHVHERSDETST
jgi:hypothetical protein